MPWTLDFEESAPPGAPARDVVDELYAMVEGGWLMAATVDQQLGVFKSVCEGFGWYWPMVAKVLRRGVGGGPPNRLTPKQRSELGRTAANRSWAQTVVWAERTFPAREAFMRRFEREVDPTGTLDPEQRRRMVKKAKSVHFSELAREGARARGSRH